MVIDYAIVDPACGDYLELHDGVDSSAPTIIKFCAFATASAAPYVSTGPALFIRFYSDWTSEESGFELQWTIPGRYS